MVSLPAVWGLSCDGAHASALADDVLVVARSLSAGAQAHSRTVTKDIEIRREGRMAHHNRHDRGGPYTYAVNPPRRLRLPRVGIEEYRANVAAGQWDNLTGAYRDFPL